MNAAWRNLLNVAEKRRNAKGWRPCTGSTRSTRRPICRTPAPSPVVPFRPISPAEVLHGIQSGTLRYRYRNRALLKSPFDLPLYLRLLGRLSPRTVIEVGTFEGGSALWFADMLTVLGIDGRVVTIDSRGTQAIEDPRITSLTENGLDLGSVLSERFLRELPRPWLVIDDSAHTFEVTLAILAFFDDKLTGGDYIAVEGRPARITREQYRRYLDGPSRAIEAFLATRSDRYEIDTDLCDFYGFNVTYNPNAWLRRR